jgi:hypothetical protein
MDSIALLKQLFDTSHRWYLGTVEGLTEQQANFVPPGTTHPIGALIQHTIMSEDSLIHTRLMGQPSIWERDGWGERTGQQSLQGADEAAYRAFRMQPNALDEYREAVWRETDAYLDTLNEADLDREIELRPGRTMSFAGYFGIVLNNNFSHVGEISVVKGLQGLKGYAV